jgi:hypothetical protein
MISGSDEQPSGVPHGDLVVQVTDVEVGRASLAALAAEQVAALSNPGGGLGEFGT